MLLLILSPALTSARCGQPFVPIPRIQGEEGPSPLRGQTVITEGVITLDLRHPEGFAGFYLQQDDASASSPGLPQPASRALFVDTTRAVAKPGHRVRLEGTVSEAYGLTRLAGVTRFTDCGLAALPEAVPLSLPLPEQLDFRQLESMRVTLAKPLAITDSYDLGRYGELVLAPEVQPVPTQILEPGPEAAQLYNQQEQQRLRLDDGRRTRNPRPVPYPPPTLSSTHPLRIGDRIFPLTGVLDFRFGHWRLHPEEAPGFLQSHPRPEPIPRPAPHHIRVMAFNLENYFNGHGDGSGFPAPRGAATHEVYQAQRARVTAAVRAADPDILAVMELENDGDGPRSSLAELTAALGKPWRFIPAGNHSGRDAIRVAFLYREGRVEPVGPLRSLAEGAFARGNRPALVQDFRPGGQGSAVRVVALHLKSKSCRNATGADRDQQDGQACFAGLRTRAVTELTDWLETLPRPQDLAGTLLAGDLNSYARETPLQVLATQGFTNLVPGHSPASGSSFRYHGRVGTLDYLLADAALLPAVTQAWIWAINAEEPRLWSVHETRPPEPPALTPDQASPWRSSDHNPVIVDLDPEAQ